MNLPADYHIMDDVVFEIGNGTIQIDHLVISKYGIFAIETKNYRGKIYGSDSHEQWKQIIITKVRFRRKLHKTYTYCTKNKFYNPVKQSISHVNAIKRILKALPNIKVIPIVAFTGSAKIYVCSKYHVVYDDDLLRIILSYQTQDLPDKDVQKAIDILSANNVRDFIDNRTHVRNVKAAKRKQHYEQSMGYCPRCGGRLVLRDGKYGSFYGCSNYPDCKFTMRRKD